MWRPLALGRADPMLPMTTKYTIKAGKVEITDSTETEFITYVVTALAQEATQGWYWLVGGRSSGFG